MKKMVIGGLGAALALCCCLVSLAADFNGDGTNDIGIFRPSSGLWALRGITRVYYGVSGDVPMPGDYNGDGTVDVCIYRPSNGTWAVRGISRVYYGTSTDQPLAGIPASGGGGGYWTQDGTAIYYDVPTARFRIYDVSSCIGLKSVDPTDGATPVDLNTVARDFTMYAGEDTLSISAVLEVNKNHMVGIKLYPSDPTSALDIEGTNGYNQLRMRTSYTPTSGQDTNGNVGDVAWDNSYFYVKTTGGWKRAALSTW